MKTIRISRRLWLVLDIVLVGSVCVTGAQLYRKLARPAAQLGKPAPLLQPGDRFSVPGITWSNVLPTVIVFGYGGCQDAEDSIPLYKKLSQQRKSQSPFYFVLISIDTANESREWLRKAGIEVDLVAHVTNPPASGLYLSPTLVVVGPNGLVHMVFATRLLPIEEEALWTDLSGAPVAGPLSNMPDEVNEQEFAAMADEAFLIDGRAPESFQLSHRAGAVNIPFGQLEARLEELPPSKRLVVDCPAAIATSCPAAGTILRRRGFSEVSLLFSGLNPK